VLEEKKFFWIQAGKPLPVLGEIQPSNYDLVYNIVCSEFNVQDVIGTVDKIRTIHCGFEFHNPKINIFININTFTDDVASTITSIDYCLPQITTNLIISDVDIHKDPIVSIAHKKHDIAVKHKIYPAFYFVLFEDYRILGLALRKITQLIAILESHTDNISGAVPVVLELSPVIFENKNKSFYEGTHFEIDNMIEELSLYTYFTMEKYSSICGLINILRQVALSRGISEKFFTLSSKEIEFSFSERSCFYNLFCGRNLTCSECRDKLLKNLPLNLGVFDKAVRKFLIDTGEKSEFKVLAADWDYIV
jgi:hypothetical protein